MAEVINVLLWPVVVLGLGVAFILIFRKDIQTLLARMKRAKLPGGTEAAFSESAAGADATASAPDQRAVLNWKHSGNLFWVGYDLGQVITLLSQGGAKEGILDAVRQVAHHARCLGIDQLPNTKSYTLQHVVSPDAPTTQVISESVLGRLSRIMIEIQRTTDASWERRRKEQMLSEIAEIRDQLGKLAEENQSGFQAKS